MWRRKRRACFSAETCTVLETEQTGDMRRGPAVSHSLGLWEELNWGTTNFTEKKKLGKGTSVSLYKLVEPCPKRAQITFFFVTTKKKRKISCYILASMSWWLNFVKPLNERETVPFFLHTRQFRVFVTCGVFFGVILTPTSIPSSLFDRYYGNVTIMLH